MPGHRPYSEVLLNEARKTAILLCMSYAKLNHKELPKVQFGYRKSGNRVSRRPINPVGRPCRSTSVITVLEIPTEHLQALDYMSKEQFDLFIEKIGSSPEETKALVHFSADSTEKRERIEQRDSECQIIANVSKSASDGPNGNMQEFN